LIKQIKSNQIKSNRNESTNEEKEERRGEDVEKVLQLAIG
jgi:hypothetical protein